MAVAILYAVKSSSLPPWSIAVSSENAPTLVGSAPYCNVRNLAASLDYYCDVFGFRRPHLWGEPPTFAMPDRDSFIFMLKQVGQQA